jgi:oligopeptide transport system ATP-binding protein
MEINEKLLEVKNLKVSFDTHDYEVQAVRGISFHLDKGEAIAIVGESGCGKSVTAQSIMGLIDMPPGRIKEGRILFNGQDLLRLTEKQMQSIRGSKISMVFQEPMTSLNPTMKVGKQISEGLVKYQHLNKRAAKERAIEMLRIAGIQNPEDGFNQYPHQLSGGMCQRVMIAIALSCNPKILIADEPTTALDLINKKHILDLLKDIQKNFGTSIILITHDLEIVANTAQKVFVMYAGLIVESGPVHKIFYNSKHPYTWALMNSIPNIKLDYKEQLETIEGSPPDLFSPPKGCPFAPRCKYAMKICADTMPKNIQVEDGHSVSCWLQHHLAPRVEGPGWKGGKIYAP